MFRFAVPSLLFVLLLARPVTAAECQEIGDEGKLTAWANTVAALLEERSGQFQIAALDLYMDAAPGVKLKQAQEFGKKIRSSIQRSGSKLRIQIKSGIFNIRHNEIEEHDEGNTIVYWTARGTLSGIDWEDVTREQFDKWGVKFHDLKFGKPYYDVFIDDKNMNVRDWE